MSEPQPTHIGPEPQTMPAPASVAQQIPRQPGPAGPPLQAASQQPPHPGAVPFPPAPPGTAPVAPQPVNPPATVSSVPPQPTHPVTPPAVIAGPLPPQPGYQIPVAYPPAPARTSRWRAALVGGVLVVLLALSLGQTFWLARLSDRLDKAESAAAADRRSGDTAVQALASRVAVLEGAAFHPDQIAEAALPSVFRVKAGQYSGTAWAVGEPTATGGTNLFTNFHVVEAVWSEGERTVNIEHRELLYEATIVKVDEDNDIAQLETSEKFPGLVVSTTKVRPGEHIVVVGAPLGLESSVTTGVVSAFRELEGSDETYVQFDAPINPGNSGGPVINARGEVVGIATAKIRDSEGIGLAIPINLVCDLFPICD